MNHLSLFSGIGGLDLAAEMAGFKTVGQCEWADYPTKVLEKHWPDVPRWRDIRTLSGTRFQKEKFERDSDVFRSCERRPAKPGLGGVADGVPAWMDRYWAEAPTIPRITTVKENRADRLKCLGNAVYWRQFYPIFHGIMEVMNRA